MSHFVWTEEAREAAQLLAEGELRFGDIADRACVSRQTLWAWRKNAEFTARVEEISEAINAGMFRRAISHRERRLDRLTRDWIRLQRLIEERASAPIMQGVPGGTTGLLCHTKKSLGSGESATVVDEFAFDAAILKELRELEKQAAMEVGQWTEKRELTGKDGGPVEHEVSRRIKIVEVERVSRDSDGNQAPGNPV